MKCRAVLLSIMAILAGCAAPPAPPVANSPFPQTATDRTTVVMAASDGPAAAVEMAGFYRTLCLNDYNNGASLQANLGPLSAEPLSPAEVSRILHADPGRGWRFATQTAHYVLTIEAPPYNTCAVRRMTRFGLPTAKPYIAVMNAYAASHGLSLGPVQHLTQTTPGGANVMLSGTPLMAPGQAQPRETSIYAITNYHGRFDPASAPEAVGGVGVEVRMAHQVLGAAPT